MIPLESGGNLIANSSYMKQVNSKIKMIGVEPDYSPALIGGVAKYTYDNAKECIDEYLAALCLGYGTDTVENFQGARIFADDKNQTMNVGEMEMALKGGFITPDDVRGERLRVKVASVH